MKAIDIIRDVAQTSGIDLDQIVQNNEKFRTHLFRRLNIITRNFNSKYKWPWTEKFTSFQTTPNYITGAVEVTQGSRTVTGSGGASFTSSMVGRFIKLDRETEIYEIVAVPTSTTLTLKESYIGASGSGLNYLIWRRYYVLDPDVPFLSDVEIWRYPYKVIPLPLDEFSGAFTNLHSTGFPDAFAWAGVDKTLTTYSTGTISTTKNSKSLTGSSTAFLGNVFNGSKIVVGSNIYNVETIDSDTAITLVQFANDTVAGSAYRAETQNRSRIILSSVPSPAMNLSVTYHKRVYDMVNENDEPEIWPEYELALINILYAYTLEKLTSDKSIPWLTVSEAQVREVLRSLIENEGIKVATRYAGRGTRVYRQALYG